MDQGQGQDKPKKLAYIVLTCEKYETTRKIWQETIVFSESERADVYFLGHRMSPGEHMYSWGARDNYESLPYKFADFFRYSELDYDWYFLMDDDTFVYTDRLRERVRQLEEGVIAGGDGGQWPGIDARQDHYMEGCVLTHIAASEWGIYHSGGAGTLLSAKVYQLLQSMFQTISTQYQPPHWCADICLRQWTRDIPGLRFVHCPMYHSGMEGMGVPEEARRALTFHHLKEEGDFRACSALR